MGRVEANAGINVKDKYSGNPLTLRSSLGQFCGGKSPTIFTKRYNYGSTMFTSSIMYEPVHRLTEKRIEK